MIELLRLPLALQNLTVPTEFTKDLLIDPITRNTHDISHSVVAVASSSGKDRAEVFKNQLQIPDPCAVYGTYDELVHDPNVDIIYVASPHSHHYQHTMMALQAGKHVVCEKPITVNANQAKALYETAKTRGLFLLDAVWTRYFPLSVQIRELIKNGAIGEVLRVVADISMGEDVVESPEAAKGKYGTCRWCVTRKYATNPRSTVSLVFRI